MAPMRFTRLVIVGILAVLGVMAADAVAQAVVRAVKLAVTLGGVPGLG